MWLMVILVLLKLIQSNCKVQGCGKFSRVPPKMSILSLKEGGFDPPTNGLYLHNNGFHVTVYKIYNMKFGEPYFSRFGTLLIFLGEACAFCAYSIIRPWPGRIEGSFTIGSIEAGKEEIILYF